VVNISNVVLSLPAYIIMFLSAFGAILFTRMLVVAKKLRFILFDIGWRELVGNRTVRRVGGSVVI